MISTLATKNIVRCSNENVTMRPVFKEYRSIVNNLLFTYWLMFFRAAENIIRFSHENVTICPVFKEYRSIVNIVNS